MPNIQEVSHADWIKTGIRIQEEIDRNKMTYAQLAEYLTNVYYVTTSRQYVSKICKGETFPQLYTLKAMAEVFDCKKDSWSAALRRVGYEMGRFIYILDAYDDLEKDEKSGSFNPLLPMKERPGFDQYVRGILTMALSDCTAAFETLPVVENIDILRNILYSGIWCKFEEKHRKRMEAEASAERTSQDE